MTLENENHDKNIITNPICEKCTKKFKTKQTLGLHIKNVHEVANNVFTLCMQGF